MDDNGSKFDCIWCPAVFSNSESFWEHMRAGSCSPSQANPTTTTNTAADHAPSQKNAEPALQTAVQPPPPPSLPPPQPISIDSSSEPPFVFPKPDINTSTSTPQIRSSASSSSLQSKWKCTLCNVNFTDKATLMAHVKSREHEERIISTRFTPDTPLSSANVPLPKPQPPSTMSTKALLNGIPSKPNFDTPKLNGVAGGGISTEFVTDIVRKVVRDEVRQMIRAELREMFEFMLTRDRLILPLTTTSPVEHTAQGDKFSPETSSLTASAPSNLSSEIKGSFLEYQGNSVQCLACNCCISSPANLQAHLEGKKHKNSMEKFAAVRS